MAVQLFGSRTLLIMTASTFVIGVCQSECQHEIVRATVGMKLELMCFFEACFTYEWFVIINGTSQPTSRSTNSTLKIADNVTSVMEVGGREYQCRCNDGRVACTKFTIWVMPVVNLTFSKPRVKAGESVNVTCTAESYPPANQRGFYSLQHPAGITVVPTHLTTGVDGVIHEIPSANSSDDGEYDCVVTVTALVDDRNESMASETVQRNLTVYYDPPYIKHVNNVSTYLDSNNIGKSALLNCEVENMEPGLNMWVKWVSINASMIENITLRNKDMFFLHLYNITRDDDLVYGCWLYSEHSPDQPIDKKIAVISEINCPSCKDGISRTNEGNTSVFVILICLFSMIIIVLVALVVTFSIVILKMQKKGQYRRQDDHELPDMAVKNNNFTDLPTLGNNNISSAVEAVKFETVETQARKAVEEEHSQTVMSVEIEEDHSQTEMSVEIEEDHSQTEMSVEMEEDHSQTETAAAEIIDAEEDHSHSPAEIQAVENNQTQEESENGSEADGDSQLFSTAHLESTSPSLYPRPLISAPAATSTPLPLPLPPMQTPPPQPEEDTTTILQLQPDEGIVPPPPQPEMGSAPPSKSITILSSSKPKSRPTDDLEKLLLDSEPSSSLRTESAVNDYADTIDNV